MKKISDDKIKKILELRKKGMSYEKIARELNLSTLTVVGYCKPETRKKILERSRKHVKKLYEKDRAKYSYYMIKSLSKHLTNELKERLKKEVFS